MLKYAVKKLYRYYFLNNPIIKIKIEAPTTETIMVPIKSSAEIPNKENTTMPINEPQFL